MSYEIEQLWIEGLNAGQIARELECDIAIVLAWIADVGLKEMDDA